MHTHNRQLLGKSGNADKASSAVAPVGPVLRFPDGGCVLIVREVQELSQEPGFCLISKPSLPSLQGDLAGPSLPFACPEAKGESHFLAPRP